MDVSPHTFLRLRAAILLILLLLSISLLGYSFTHSPEGVLRVVFFDVGQGDSIFIESPTGIQIVVDAGPDRSVLRELSRELGFWDRTLDMVLLTHEDKDHVGGMPEIFAHYAVGTFVRTENQAESVEADRIDDVTDTEPIFARRGMVFDIGGGAYMEILFPDRDPSFLESNTSSIVARVVYGEHEFLLTGDAPSSIEAYLVSTGEDLTSDVLKAGHHGSRTSTSKEFVAAVAPRYAVVSAGKDNRYGHPHEEVIDILTDAQATILNTAEEGSIIFETDGRALTVR